MNKHYLRISLLSSLLIVSACSHTPSVGEQMVAQGSDTKKLGQKWEKGDDLIAKGHKKIKHGESMIEKGKNQIQEGHNMIKKGHKMENKSEHVFHEKFPEISRNFN